MPNKLLIAVATLLAVASVRAQTPPALSSPPAAGGTELKYRDPAVPLTIGEMSALQASKVEADFYKKLGFTVVAPPTGPTAAELAKKAIPKPMASFRLLGIYGPSLVPVADVIVNGLLLTVKGGERLPGGLQVVKVAPSELTLVIPSKKKRGSPTTHTVKVGDVLEFVI